MQIVMVKFSLDQLAQKEHGNVVGFLPELKSLSRLLSFGLLPGCPVTMLQNSGTQSLLLEARGMKIALDRFEAQKIQIVKS